jgi:hypothetical protein
MKAKTTLYRSYLLRLYGKGAGGEMIWRASLEDPAGAESVRFSSLQALFHYLEEQCAGSKIHPALNDGLEP